MTTDQINIPRTGAPPYQIRYGGVLAFLHHSLRQNMKQKAISDSCQKWLSDIIFILTACGFTALVICLFSRRYIRKV